MNISRSATTALRTSIAPTTLRLPAGPGNAAEAALAAYLDNGGCLALSSQDYHYDRGQTVFMTDYLGVSSIQGDTGQGVVTGAGPLAGLGPYALDHPFDDWSDQLTPDSMAQVVFEGDNGSTAIGKHTGVYETMFFGFPLEALEPMDRKETISAVLNGCGMSGQSARDRRLELCLSVILSAL